MKAFGINMVRWTASAAILLSVSSFGAEQRLSLTENLTGAWAGNSPGPTADQVIYIETLHDSDGRFSGALEIRSISESVSPPRCIEFSGFWLVEGDILAYRDITYSNGLHVPSIKDRVVDITPTMVNYVALDDGLAFERHRIPHIKMECNESMENGSKL